MHRASLPPSVSLQASQVSDSELVVEEVARGEGLSLAQLAKRLPAARGGGTATASALWRWAIQGKRSPDGRTVKLGVCRIGPPFEPEVGIDRPPVGLGEHRVGPLPEGGFGGTQTFDHRYPGGGEAGPNLAAQWRGSRVLNRSRKSRSAWVRLWIP